MEEYKSNSHKSREKQQSGARPENKKIKKVVTGAAKTKKKNGIRKFADVFISDDVSNVKSYILEEVLIPNVKKAISDIVTNGIDMVLYGESGRTKKNTSKISYRNFYDKRDDRREYGSVGTRGFFDYDDIIFDSRGDAELALNTMEEAIEQYGVVSVGDLYDLAGIVTTNYTVNRYGWTDIRSAQVIHVKDGYLLKLPRALPLN